MCLFLGGILLEIIFLVFIFSKCGLTSSIAGISKLFSIKGQITSIFSSAENGLCSTHSVRYFSRKAATDTM